MLVASNTEHGKIAYLIRYESAFFHNFPGLHFRVRRKVVPRKKKDKKLG